MAISRETVRFGNLQLTGLSSLLAYRLPAKWKVIAAESYTQISTYNAELKISVLSWLTLQIINGCSIENVHAVNLSYQLDFAWSYIEMGLKMQIQYA